MSKPLLESNILSEIKELQKQVNAVALAASGSIPTGTYLFTAAASAPSGFLMCEGQAVSRRTYAKLFETIRTEYGAGDGSTTFNLPDMRGRALYGKGTHTDVDALTDSDGTAVGSRTPKHTHTGPSHTHSFSGTTGLGSHLAEVAAVGSFYRFQDGDHVHSFSGTTGAGGTGSTGTSNPSYGVANVMIKT